MPLHADGSPMILGVFPIWQPEQVIHLSYEREMSGVSAFFYKICRLFFSFS